MSSILCCALAGACGGGSREESGRPEVDSLMTRLMATYDVPGVGLALVRHDDIYTRGYGVRSTETGEPVTPQTVFSIGSVSKSLAALTAMRMVARGTLDLDAPVTRYLADFRLPSPADADALTLRHLLSQTSGFPTLPEWPLPTREAWWSG